MKTSITRRTFLTGTAASATGLLILPSSRSALAYPANERINLAIIGHMYNAGHFFSSVHAYENLEIVALCDPDQREIPKVFKTWQEQAQTWATSPKPEQRKAAEHYKRLLDNKPPAYADFRRMLSEMDKQIDALVVSLYDHYHGVTCGTAMRMGKHVFSERPLGLTIGESRALRDLAAQQKVATSIRNPGNASNQFRRGVELVRQGILGSVQEVHVWFDRGGPDHRQPPQGTPPIPDGLHWDLWLGPVADRPYHPEWMAYATWRQTSNGGIGTFGPHASNLAFMSLDVQALWQPTPGANRPTIRVQAQCPNRNRLSFPRWETTRWTLPPRRDLPPATFTWYHGPGLPPGERPKLLQMMIDRGASKEESEKLLGYAGAMIVGSKGILVTDDHNVKFTLLPKDSFQNLDQDRPKTLPPSRGHYADWLIHCRGGQPAMANFAYANPLSEFLMLGNIATQFDAELEYDPIEGRILNHPQAHQALSYQYRKGWIL